MSLGLLACAELLARRFAPPEEGVPLFGQYVSESSGPFFRIETENGREVLVQVPRHPYFPAPQRLDLRKEAGRRRVVVLGESSALFFGNDLRREVLRSALGSGLEVVNMGVGAADLEQTLRRFDEAARISPDEIVLLFGHNLFFRIPLQSLDPPALRPLTRLAQKSRLLDFLVKWSSHFLPSPENYNASGRQRAFRAALTRMAAQSRRRGIRLIVCTMPANLRAPPHASRQALCAAPLLEARCLYWSGRAPAAVECCRRALLKQREAWWSFQLGEWLHEAGRYAQARKFLLQARDDDPGHGRASSAFNALIRATAKEQGLLLLDFEKLSQDRAPHGIPGWESFSDFVHVRGTAFEIEEFLRATDRPRHPAPAQPQKVLPPDAAPQRFERRGKKALQHTLLSIPLSDPSLRAAVIPLARTYLPWFLLRGEKEVLDLPRSPQDKALLLCGIAEAFWRAGRREPALELNAQARRLAPAQGEPCLQRALFHLASGEKDAARLWLRKTLELDPENPEALYDLKKLEEAK